MKFQIFSRTSMKRGFLPGSLVVVFMLSLSALTTPSAHATGIGVEAASCDASIYTPGIVKDANKKRYISITSAMTCTDSGGVVFLGADICQRLQRFVAPSNSWTAVSEWKCQHLYFPTYTSVNSTFSCAAAGVGTYRAKVKISMVTSGGSASDQGHGQSAGLCG